VQWLLAAEEKFLDGKFSAEMSRKVRKLEIMKVLLLKTSELSGSFNKMGRWEGNSSGVFWSDWRVI
jgi:hypothetical protein